MVKHSNRTWHATNISFRIFFFPRTSVKTAGTPFSFRSSISPFTSVTTHQTIHSTLFALYDLALFGSAAPFNPPLRASLRFYLFLFFLFFVSLWNSFYRTRYDSPFLSSPCAKLRAPLFRDAVRNASVSLDDLKFPSLANSCPRSTRGNLNRTGQTVSPLWIERNWAVVLSLFRKLRRNQKRIEFERYFLPSFLSRSLSLEILLSRFKKYRKSVENKVTVLLFIFFYIYTKISGMEDRVETRNSKDTKIYIYTYMEIWKFQRNKRRL